MEYGGKIKNAEKKDIYFFFEIMLIFPLPEKISNLQIKFNKLFPTNRSLRIKNKSKWVKITKHE